MKTLLPVHTYRSLAVSLVLAISMVGVSYGAGGVLPGDGTSESTAYLIEDLADFDVFADPNNGVTYWLSSVYTKLVCDINLAGRTYTTAVIAPDTPDTSANFDGISFKGFFDGNGHIISNLTIDTAGAGNDFLGLFGRSSGYSTKIRNLGLENVDITSGTDSRFLGGLCGYNDEGRITNCYATGSVTGGVKHLGGLCGFNYQGTISNCYAAGSITGGDYSNNLGGLCGDNHEVLIINCYATGSVTGGDCSDNLGGLCGYNDEGIITNCYATGSVTGRDCLGGLCGCNYRYSTITNCYAAGLVTGGDNSWRLGGLCGKNYSTITNCYFYLLSGPDNNFGTALDDLEMQDAASFVGFDFAGNPNDGQDDYWMIVNGYCPKLTWQTDDGPSVSLPVTTLSGSGHSYDPFQINSCADFTEFRTNSGLRYGYYILATDIDLSGDTFATAVINRYFGGHFDGNSHIIRNITIDTAGANNSYLGLFSKIYYASVSNLGVENINITGGDYSHSFGGLCGEIYNGAITNCYATGSVTGGTESLGGLCGSNYHGTITNCYSTGLVTGGCYLGGLCGYNGWNSTITNCYSTGLVTGGCCPGGLCGWNDFGTISNCFWDVETSGMIDGVENQDPDPAGVIGKTTAQMQTESTFTDAGWDFSVVPVWRMPFEVVGYPMLGWQKDIPGDFTGRYGVGMDDFAILSNAWLSDDTPTAKWNEHCDLNGSGVIEIGDLKKFVENWLAGT